MRAARSPRWTRRAKWLLMRISEWRRHSARIEDGFVSYTAMPLCFQSELAPSAWMRLLRTNHVSELCVASEP